VGFKPHPLRRMTLGMLLTGLSFVAVALIQHALDAGVRVHVFWQIIPYLILTTAEVMVSITGLEFGYSQAPKRMKSVIMGFWLLAVAIGNVLVALLSGFKSLDPAAFFWVFAGLMASPPSASGARTSIAIATSPSSLMGPRGPNPVRSDARVEPSAEAT
jgi:POT family proton-dependent oligopeptide transporter